jgi:RNA polymerase sigma-70 factor (ECF subfamily)
MLQRTGPHASRLVYEGKLDGLPGFVTVEADGTWQSTALAIEEGRIVTIYVTRNPDKLRALLRTLGEDTPS